MFTLRHITVVSGICECFLNVAFIIIVLSILESLFYNSNCRRRRGEMQSGRSVPFRKILNIIRKEVCNVTPLCYAQHFAHPFGDRLAAYSRTRPGACFEAVSTFFAVILCKFLDLLFVDVVLLCERRRKREDVLLRNIKVCSCIEKFCSCFEVISYIYCCYYLSNSIILVYYALDYDVIQHFNFLISLVIPRSKNDSTDN